MWLDKQNPGKYDTFFEFAPYTTTTFSEFDAIRWQPAPAEKGKVDLRRDEKGNPIEKKAHFKRNASTRGEFMEEGTGRGFVLNNSEYMTGAVVLKPDDGGEPTRYKAELKQDRRTGALTYTGERKFLEENGSRYFRSDQLGVLYVPSNSVVVFSLLINFALFVVWFLVLWPVMRFSWAHALGFTAVFGLVTMLIVLPLLFKPNRTPKARAGESTAWRSDTNAIVSSHIFA